ncbi:probable maleylacetoacetate isomerase 2 [Drosophila grimshawi]|uniref:maleylacetoacetate isomerase n=1 Tax=Drosophila grimshawi TaxID=7222 RepID=B4JEK7_DROGR|nr:probable maleylacetoacetate isomerase 2 [Drosophila grimshawi]EDV93138.1 GH19140 [Drosophila grimshawi]
MSALRKSTISLLNLAGNGTRRLSSSDAKPVLYSYYASSCAWRVRIALGLKGIPYEIKATHLFEPNAPLYSNSSEYQEINPTQLVPALKIDGQILCDSVAIMHYLEQTKPQQPLLPQDPFKRAKVLQIVQIICSGIQPLQNASVLDRVGKKNSLEWAQYWISSRFAGLEKVLSASSGKFCVGDEISMADCCLVPQVFNARRFRVNLNPFPTIVKLDDSFGTQSAVRASHPYNQPDCPPELANKQKISK